MRVGWHDLEYGVVEVSGWEGFSSLQSVVVSWILIK